MDFNEILEKAESDEPIYLSHGAKKMILNLRNQDLEDKESLFSGLFDEVGELIDCVLTGGEINPMIGKEILITLNKYRSLLKELLVDEHNDFKSE